MAFEVTLDVQATIENIHDFHTLLAVTKENDIPLMRKRPDVGPQFRAMGSKRTGQIGKIVASGHEFFDKGLSDRQIPAFSRDTTQDVSQIVSG
ncbi:hypothetical protein A0J57_19570 [Sphingobium sp. 22B]|uniref:Uncharacterized protein n=2 Tax=Sphingobium TaxID=165695 RepID=A0A0M3AHQ6_9SPHN|nr:hypothetical protein YP76_25910 [Sphingobium chungbukense]KXU30845.1 hypothetical protein AXW74_15800 [Sphingobium sp. AM]KYC30671.1 hypothetical protein A0J57_19570 [Sphingobium sp. 22B]OAP30393.1 hypothetical protein A8O16_18875 [Sphingobium sp. 20006FA]PNQ02542.1 hypothetical protein A8G00_13175 [Sphingobium sp. SA916]GAY24780.1 hypothetical protein SFOMI_5365 [Sphingobium fuliginis]